MELSGRSLVELSADLFDWSQWHDIHHAPIAQQAFEDSLLYPGTKNRHCQWSTFQSGLAANAQGLALGLVSIQAWEQLDAWMERSGLSPWDRMSVVPAHWKTKSGWAMSGLRSTRPVPFWAAAVFNGAQDLQFWDIMARHGGPASPVLARVRPPRRLPGKLRLPRCASPAQWSSPLAWLSADPSDPWGYSFARTEGLEEKVADTLSSWRRQALARAAQPPASNVLPQASKSKM
jgi:hypothetical protein